MKAKGVLLALSCLSFFFASGGVRAEEVYLRNGDKVSGDLVRADDQVHIVKTEAMGEVTIRNSAIDRIVAGAKDMPLPPQASNTGLPPASHPARAKRFRLWDGEVSGGFDRRNGNTHTMEVNGQVKIHRKLDLPDRKNEFNLEGNTHYAEQAREMNAQKHHGMARYAFSFGPGLRWYDFYRFEADHDRFANIDYRLTPSTGIGYWLAERTRFKTFAELGIGVEHTNYHDRKASETEGILIPRIYVEKILFRELKVYEDFTAYPSFTNAGHYRLRSESALENPISERLALRFIVLDEYNSSPGGGANKNDLRLTSALVYKY